MHRVEKYRRGYYYVACYDKGSIRNIPVVPLRVTSDVNRVHDPLEMNKWMRRYTRILARLLKYTSQGTLGTAICAIQTYLGTWLTRFQQGMIKRRLWREKQRKLYAPALLADLPSGVRIGLIKDRRWALFRRKAKEE